VALFEVSGDELLPHTPAKFKGLEMYERADLQRLLRSDVKVIDPNLLVIAEEFGNWEDAKRRIDLLAIDHDARLVVIELKRTESGGHMELQAIRYAAMVSTMAFEDVLAALEAHRAKLPGSDPDVEPEEELRAWIDATDPDEAPEIASDVGIVLVSADFGREITTAVIWLNKFEGMDIRCVRLQPYEIDGKVILDIEQVLPLPEAADYQVRLRKKEAATERARADSRDLTKYVILRRGVSGPVQTKRGAMLEMVQALHTAGIPMSKIKDVLPSARMRVIPAVGLDPDAISEELLKANAKIRPRRWFLEEVFEEDGMTFVLQKMWGRNTEPVLSKLVAAFPDAGVSFERA
jgi:hypothetical protein